VALSPWRIRPCPSRSDRCTAPCRGRSSIDHGTRAAQHCRFADPQDPPNTHQILPTHPPDGCHTHRLESIESNPRKRKSKVKLIRTASPLAVALGDSRPKSADPFQGRPSFPKGSCIGLSRMAPLASRCSRKKNRRWAPVEAQANIVTATNRAMSCRKVGGFWATLDRNRGRGILGIVGDTTPEFATRPHQRLYSSGNRRKSPPKDDATTSYNSNSTDEEWTKFNPNIHYQNRSRHAEYAPFRRRGFQIKADLTEQPKDAEHQLGSICLADWFRTTPFGPPAPTVGHYVLSKVTAI
jgi:hypothetical protein